MTRLPCGGVAFRSLTRSLARPALLLKRRVSSPVSEHFLRQSMTDVTVKDTAMADRREQATDQRGLPSSFAKALEALRGRCTHCDQRATISTGAGVGLCERHRRERTDRDRAGVLARERVRRQLEMAKRDL
jgi:hypothetical protein